MQQGAAGRVGVGGLQLLGRLLHGGDRFVELVAAGELAVGDAQRRSHVGQLAFRARVLRHVCFSIIASA